MGLVKDGHDRREAGIEPIDDPVLGLSRAVCDLLCTTHNLTDCGAISLNDPAVFAVSAGLSAHVDSARKSARAAFVPGESPPFELTVSMEGGCRVFAAQGSETGLIVLAAPEGGEPIPAGTLDCLTKTLTPVAECAGAARATLSGLADKIVLLSHIETLTNTGAWEVPSGSDTLTGTEAIFAIHGLTQSDRLSWDALLQLYPSPAREKLAIELDRSQKDGGGFDITAPIETPGGERRVIRTVGRSIPAHKGAKLYGIAQDVSEQLAAERRLWWAANHDPVTKLPNRLLFEDRIAVSVHRAKREGRELALLLIEISDFARLTGHSGYTLPDKRMQEVARRLETVTRESDTLARISTSEFALILSNVDGEPSFSAAMSRLEAEFAEQRQSDGDGLVMSAGAAFFPAHAESADLLTRAAEMALSQAKRRLDRPVIIFERHLADDTAGRRESVLSRAREGLSRGEFVPFYQPQLDIRTKAMVGVEALVRWTTDEAMFDPGDFYYALDDHEIGSRIGRAVLDQVIDDVARLRERGPLPFRVSVNASRTEILRNDFLASFVNRTNEANLRPTDFIIEITEDVIIGVDDQILHDQVSYLVSSGVEFSLDDFGTGYASLIHMTRFPISEVKIDKQFIFGIETDRRKRAVVRGILEIAQSMGLSVIAEGVETAEQEAVLRELGCRSVQGYLYAFPIPFAEFATMLEHHT
ncbi:MAG: bifunctional diguanylate cyclase/phosphodiesterase [Pseudomonadota bacterium]